MSIVSKLLVLIGADTTELSMALKDVATRIRNTGRAFETAGAAMVRGITLPLAAMATAAGRFSATFDKSMAQAIAVMGGVTEDMRKEMEGVARSLAKELPISAAEAAKGFTALASAGYSAQNALAALPQVARFAVAGQFDLAKATELAAQAQSSLALTSEDPIENLRQLKRVTDALAAANNYAIGSTEQFTEALTGGAGGTMRQLNMSLEEGLAILMAFQNQGVMASDASTQFMISLRELQDSVLNAKSEFDRLNIAVYDGSGNFRKVADILQDLEVAMGGMSDEQKKLTWNMLKFDAKSIKSIQTIMGFSSSIREMEKNLAAAGGTVERMTRLQIANLYDQFVILKNTFVDVGISLGHVLAPAFGLLLEAGRAIAQVMQGIVRIFGLLPKPIMVTVSALAALVAAIGPFLLVIGFVIRNIGASILAIMQLSKALSFLAVHPVAIAVVALGLLVTTITGYAIGSDKAADATRRYADQVEQLRYEADQSKKALDDLTVSIAQKEKQIRDLMAARRDAALGKLELPSVAGMGAPSMSKWLEDTRQAVLRLEDELSKLRGERWAAEQEVQVRRLAIAQAEYNRELRVVASRYAIEKNELNRINGELSAKEQYFEELIRLGQSGTIVESLNAEIAALKASRDALLEKGVALDATIEKAKVAGDAIRDMTPEEMEQKRYEEWGKSLSLTIATVHQGVMNLTNSISQGLGNAFAQAIVWGQSWSEAMVNFVKNVAAAMISFIVEVLVQQLLAFVLAQIGLVAAAGAKIGAEIAYGSVAAAASAFAAVPFPFNFAAAIAAGAAAEGLLIGIAASGFAAGRVSAAGGIALEEGGLVRQPTLALVGEAGPELVTPLDRLPKFHPMGGGDTIANLYMDGQFFAKAIIPKLPRMVRRRIGRR